MSDLGVVEIIKCRDCEYYHETHYEGPGEAPYIKHRCLNKYGLNNYTVRPNEDFCSRAERRKYKKSDTEEEKTDAFLQLIFDEMAQKCREYAKKNHQKELPSLVEMTVHIDPIKVVQYLENNGWKVFPRKDQAVKILQYKTENELLQVNVPMDKTLFDYEEAMYKVVATVAIAENKKLATVFSYFMGLNY